MPAIDPNATYSGVIDFEIPKDQNPTGRFFIKDVIVLITSFGYRGWLEAPTSDAFGGGLNPVIQNNMSAYLRGVHGYVVWGFGSQRNIQLPTEEDATREIPAIWYKSEFINWELSYFKADGFPTSLRVWLRPGVQAQVFYNIGTQDPIFKGANPSQLSEDGVNIYPP